MAMVKKHSTTRKSPRSVYVEGVRLREIRRRLGWTQERAAHAVGYSDRLLRRLEAGGPVDRQTLADFLAVYAAHGANAAAPEDYIVDHLRDDLERWTRDWFDTIFQARDLSIINARVHPDGRLWAHGRLSHGAPAIQARLESILSAFDPLDVELEQLHIDAEVVIAFWKAEGVHVGQFLGVPGSGRKVVVRGSCLLRWRRGQIVEIREHWDSHDLVRQMTGASAAEEPP